MIASFGGPINHWYVCSESHSRLSKYFTQIGLYTFIQHHHIRILGVISKHGRAKSQQGLDNSPVGYAENPPTKRMCLSKLHVLNVTRMLVHPRTRVIQQRLVFKALLEV